AVGGGGGSGDDDVGVPDCLFFRLDDADVLELRVVLLDPIGGALGGTCGAALDFDVLDARALGQCGTEDGAGHHTWADDADGLGVLEGEVLNTHARDGAGAVGGEQVRGHHGQRCAGDGVVEDEQVDGTRQVVLAVVGVGAVPLHTGVLEAAADVGGHSHKA